MLCFFPIPCPVSATETLMFPGNLNSVTRFSYTLCFAFADEQDEETVTTGGKVTLD